MHHLLSWTMKSWLRMNYITKYRLIYVNVCVCVMIPSKVVNFLKNVNEVDEKRDDNVARIYDVANNKILFQEES